MPKISLVAQGRAAPGRAGLIEHRTGYRRARWHTEVAAGGSYEGRCVVREAASHKAARSKAASSAKATYIEAAVGGKATGRFKATDSGEAAASDEAARVGATGETAHSEAARGAFIEAAAFNEAACSEAVIWGARDRRGAAAHSHNKGSSRGKSSRGAKSGGFSRHTHPD